MRLHIFLFTFFSASAILSVTEVVKEMGIGLTLKQLIEMRHTNVNEISVATGVNPQTIYSIIKRDSLKANIDDLGKIASFLGVDLNYFYLSSDLEKAKTAAQPDDGLTEREHEIALAYRVASADDRAVVDAALKKYIADGNEDSPELAM